MKKKWFTLLELIMVIGIIFILIVTFRNVFQNTNKDYLYAETCVNKIHWDMNNFLYSAMTSRGLYISTGSITGTIFPQQYVVSIIPENNEIKLSYKTQDNTTWIYIQYDLSSEILEKHYCKTNNYTTSMSWDNFDIVINKASLQDQTLPTFTINDGSEIFTQSTKINICHKWGTCKEIANFITDIRTQNIQKKRCVLINTEWIDCLKRDQ